MMNGKTKSGESSDLGQRTKAFALRVIRLYTALPKQELAFVLGKQMLRSGTSVGACYREGPRARSRAEFVSKVEMSLQELEETVYWLELIGETELVNPARLGDLLGEANQLIAILTASVRTAKARAKMEKTIRKEH